MKKIFIFILLLLFSIACSDNTSLDIKPTPSPTSENNLPSNIERGKFIEGDFSEKKALEFLYGNYDEAQKESNWRPTKEDLAKVDESSGLKEEKEFYVTVVLISAFQQKGVDKQLLITSSVPPEYTCHICAPIISANVFTKNGNNWELELEQKYVAEIGVYGTAPDAKLVKLGKDNYGVLFETGDVSQGFTYEGIRLIANIDEGFKEILNIETAGDNSGTCGEADLGPCWKFSSKYEFVEGKNPNFFDFKISTTGTKAGEEEKTIVPIEENKTYLFNGKEYNVPK